MCQLRIQQAVCCFCRQQFFFALRAYVIQLRFGCVKALGKRERHIQHAARLHRAAIQQQRNIKCRKVNRHRRIEFEELRRYQAAQQQQSEQALQDLTRLSEELGLEF